MSAWSADLRRREGGSVAVEFALVLPVLLLIFLIVVELGRVFFQANAVEKGLRAGALFAARTTLPLSESDRETIENLVRTGDPTGSAAVIASGWALPGATLDVDTSGRFDPGDGPVPIIDIEASVPFDPLLPGLESMFGLGTGYRITARQQQPYIGN